MKHVYTGVSLLSFLAMAPQIQAHGPSLKIDKPAAAPGEEITIRGEGLTTNGEIQLTLQGILEDRSLGSVRGDEHGRFEKTLTLPSELSPGEYTVVAAGDEKATVKLTIRESEESAGSSEPAPMEHDEHGGHESGEAPADGDSPHANPEPMMIERSTRGASRALAWGVTLVAGVLGVGLLARERGK